MFIVSDELQEVLDCTKLSRAEGIMHARPSLSIAEVARQVGYKDPFYFPTVYRKYRGFPPSKYRNEM